MKFHRFIVNGIDLKKQDILIADQDLVHQIKNVLKLEPKEHLILADNLGNEAVVELVELGRKEIAVSLIKASQNKNEAVRLVTLYCAILKKENFDLIVEKATEVGVFKIVPVVTERTIKKDVNLERLNKIAKEAAEQSGRAIVPEVCGPMKLKTAVELAKENELNLLFQLQEPMLNLDKLKKYKTAGIFIGPEGGWTDKEVELLSDFCDKAGLGNTTLRGETAAIVASYLVSRF